MEWRVQVLIGVLLALLATKVGLWWAFKPPLWQRFWDWLTYRSPTDEQIAELVARSVANARHESWHRCVWSRCPPGAHFGGPVTGELRHSFTELTTEEIAERDAKEAHGGQNP